MLYRLPPARLFAGLFLGVVLSFWTWTAAQAETLLRVERGGAVVAEFDRAALEAMPQITFSTATIWTEGVIEFTGVSLRALLADAGITAGDFRAIALNDYAVEMPFEDLTDDAPIIAHLMDGAPFSRRGKGPLWIVFPYDSAPEFRSETNYGRSVWQLNRISAD